MHRNYCDLGREIYPTYVETYVKSIISHILEYLFIFIIIYSCILLLLSIFFQFSQCKTLLMVKNRGFEWNRYGLELRFGVKLLSPFRCAFFLCIADTMGCRAIKLNILNQYNKVNHITIESALEMVKDWKEKMLTFPSVFYLKENDLKIHEKWTILQICLIIMIISFEGISYIKPKKRIFWKHQTICASAIILVSQISFQ